MKKYNVRTTCECLTNYVVMANDEEEAMEKMRNDDVESFEETNFNNERVLNVEEVK